MSHKHYIVDADAHCVIDAVTGAIAYESKKVIVKGSHNSERITFSIPRYIEGHDMSTCNSVILHYINTNSATKEEAPGMYEIEDVEPIDDTTVKFTWLVSNNVTRHVGIVRFGIDFRCVDEENKVVYSWPTQECSVIKVVQTVNTSDAIFTNPPDIISQIVDTVTTNITDSSDNEALYVIAETGLADPVTSEDKSFYTDENGKIYVL